MRFSHSLLLFFRMFNTKSYGSSSTAAAVGRTKRTPLRKIVALSLIHT